MKIDFANLQKQYQLYKSEIDQKIHAVLDKSNYALGEEVNQLEQAFCEFTGAKHAISCSSGTDALLLALMALDIQPDDEIITTPFTFIATAEVIAYLKAKPVFVDIEADTFNLDANKIEQAITGRTKAIMPVSLYGQAADMDAISAIAAKHNLKVIVDGAQSFGASYNGTRDSALGDISTTSFFPAKPLGCYGDGGAAFCPDEESAEKMRMMRIHGQNARYRHKYIGICGRLDTIQAAVLLAKLPHYEKEIQLRQSVADAYNERLQEHAVVPPVKTGRQSVWAQYTIRLANRDAVQQRLSEQGVPTAVHYPMPLHQQECFGYLGLKEGDFPEAEKAAKEVMSLPMNPFLEEAEIQYICDHIIQALSS